MLVSNVCPYFQRLLFLYFPKSTRHEPGFLSCCFSWKKRPSETSRGSPKNQERQTILHPQGLSGFFLFADGFLGNPLHRVPAVPKSRLPRCQVLQPERVLHLAGLLRQQGAIRADLGVFWVARGNYNFQEIHIMTHRSFLG